MCIVGCDCSSFSPHAFTGKCLNCKHTLQQHTANNNNQPSNNSNSSSATINSSPSRSVPDRPLPVLKNPSTSNENKDKDSSTSNPNSNSNSPIISIPTPSPSTVTASVLPLDSNLPAPLALLSIVNDSNNNNNASPPLLSPSSSSSNNNSAGSPLTTASPSSIRVLPPKPSKSSSSLNNQPNSPLSQPQSQLNPSNLNLNSTNAVPLNSNISSSGLGSPSVSLSSPPLASVPLSSVSSVYRPPPPFPPNSPPRSFAKPVAMPLIIANANGNNPNANANGNGNPNANGTGTVVPSVLGSPTSTPKSPINFSRALSSPITQNQTTNSSLNNNNNNNNRNSPQIENLNLSDETETNQNPPSQGQSAGVSPNLSPVPNPSTYVYNFLPPLPGNSNNNNNNSSISNIALSSPNVTGPAGSEVDLVNEATSPLSSINSKSITGAGATMPLLSFSNNLKSLNDVELVALQCADGLRVTKRVASLLKKIEIVHTRAAEEIKSILEYEKAKLDAQSKTEPWNELLPEVWLVINSLSAAHLDLAQRLGASCVRPLESIYETGEPLSEKAALNATKAVNELTNLQNNLNKEREVLANAIEVAVNLKEEEVAANFNLSSPDSSKGKSKTNENYKKKISEKSAAAREKAAKLAESYQASLNSANNKRSPLDKELSTSLTTLQNMEENRLHYSKTSIECFGEAHKNFSLTVNALGERCIKFGASFNPTSFVQKFVRKMIKTRTAANLQINDCWKYDLPVSVFDLRTSMASDSWIQSRKALSQGIDVLVPSSSSGNTPSNMNVTGNGNGIMIYGPNSPHCHKYLQVPTVIPFCISHVIALGGYESEGIYRISPDSSAVLQLRQTLEKGDYSSLSHNTSPHLPAALLKAYFRECNPPLFPASAYSLMISIGRQFVSEGGPSNNNSSSAPSSSVGSAASSPPLLSRNLSMPSTGVDSSTIVPSPSIDPSINSNSTPSHSAPVLSASLTANLISLFRNNLSGASLRTLYMLLDHLHEMSFTEKIYSETRMSASNFSIVFSPGLVREYKELNDHDTANSDKETSTNSNSNGMTVNGSITTGGPGSSGSGLGPGIDAVAMASFLANSKFGGAFVHLLILHGAEVIKSNNLIDDAWISYFHAGSWKLFSEST